MYIRHGTKDKQRMTTHPSNPITPAPELETDPKIIQPHVDYGRTLSRARSNSQGLETHPNPTTASQITEMPPKRGTKRGRPAASRSTEQVPNSSSGSGTATKKRRFFVKPVTSRPIAQDAEQCSPADRKLIELRKSDLPWPEIRRQYAEFMGEELSAPSTLPNRWKRLQCNLSNIGPDDEPTLLRCKLDVDAEIERQRWSMVAKAMVEAGCEKYEPETLQHVWRKLMLRGAHLDQHGEDPGMKGVQDGEDEEQNHDAEEEESDGAGAGTGEEGGGMKE